jgi:saccharopine dehydrogenase (NAD+, L-lysine-forming)
MAEDSSRSIQRIAVLGLGKIGLLGAELLADSGFEVTGYDTRFPRHDHPFEVKAVDVSDREVLLAELRDVDAVLSCLPYHLNIGVSADPSGCALVLSRNTQSDSWVMPSTGHPKAWSTST